MYSCTWNLKPFKPPAPLLLHVSYDLRNSRTTVGLTDDFIQKAVMAVMSAKRKFQLYSITICTCNFASREL